MPPATLPARERVYALVDHRVEAVALLCDVALHDDLPRLEQADDPVEETVEGGVRSWSERGTPGRQPDEPTSSRDDGSL